MHDLKALTQYWRRHPPVHVSVASYLGFSKPKGTRKTKDEVMRELAAVAGPSRGKFVPPIPIKPATH